MKGDFTRLTFKKENHFHDVLMQQGRVQLDSDWNEQQAIMAHRVETEAVDVVGSVGVPMHDAGFHVLPALNGMSEEEKALECNQDPPQLGANGDFYLTGGRAYVDGVLCENEHITSYLKQPDLPGATPLTSPGTYLAYLDVWQRHITALEAPEIRETALGGPDTATRTKTVWQVKLFRLGDVGIDVNCSSASQEWDNEIAAGSGRLAARAEKSDPSNNPCILAPEAGYRRLENQLYRVEIHKPGARGVATFKWSRDNGSVVAGWDAQDGNKLTVGRTGRDRASEFAGGQWIEVTDDARGLQGKPGILVRLEKAEGELLTIVPGTIIDPDGPPASPIDRAGFPVNPKIRRWDSLGEVPITADWIPLEDGVQVRFSGGTYKTGDYWLIPARTAAGSDGPGIEWPFDQDTNGPRLKPPDGVRHHYGRLALLKLEEAGWTELSDCRRIFPPLTDLTSLFYVSGDGQEAVPRSSLETDLVPLPQPLKVGVTNGSIPLGGVTVTFKVVKGKGRLKGGGAPGDNISVETGPDGQAECSWELDSATPSQQVTAFLAGGTGDVTHLPVIFTANLSRAAEVYYKPMDACPLLAGAKTVQEAIDTLCISGRGPGCCVVISADEPLVKIIESLEKKRAIRLCLQEGTHVIDRDFTIEGKEWVEIFGCGAVVQVKCRTFGIRADTISLSGTRFDFMDGAGQLCLAGRKIRGEGSVFIRGVGDEASPPLMHVMPPEGLSGTEMSWRDNRMESYWEALDSKMLRRFLIPPTDVKISPDLREKLGILAGVSKRGGVRSSEDTIKSVAHDISLLGAEHLERWMKGIAEPDISALEPVSQGAVRQFLKAISSIRTPEDRIFEALKTTLVSFRRRHFNYSLALARGVGGWIEDNDIQGYIALHFDEGFRNLAWGKTTGEQSQVKSEFEKGYADTLISVDPESLVIRGNRFRAVHSNGHLLGEGISDLLKGESLKHKYAPPSGYELLQAAENSFLENASSFIASSTILSGNQFNAPAKPDAAEAYVWGKSGMFVGNVAAAQDATLETILLKTRTEANQTNLIQIT